MTTRNCFGPRGGTQTFQSVRPAEFYSADLMVRALKQGVGKPLGAQAGMPMFHLPATGSKTYSDGVLRLNR
jgi:hypothetical protein